MILDEVERGHDRIGADPLSVVDANLNGVVQMGSKRVVSRGVDMQLSAVGGQFGSAQMAPLRTQELLWPQFETFTIRARAASPVEGGGVRRRAGPGQFQRPPT